MLWAKIPLESSSCTGGPCSSPTTYFCCLSTTDVEHRSSVARRFVRRGFQVQEASTGEEALDLAERRKFDVVILDIVMPGLSGLEVLEQLRASNQECEIITLTGQATVESAVHRQPCGTGEFPSHTADHEANYHKTPRTK
jgi:two-component system response regulator AtoC